MIMEHPLLVEQSLPEGYDKKQYMVRAKKKTSSAEAKAGAALGGKLDTLVQMRFADVPARACREGRERPELAAVATVPTAVAVGGGIRFFRDPV